MGISVRDHVGRAVSGTANVLCNGGVSPHDSAVFGCRDVIMTSSLVSCQSNWAFSKVNLSASISKPLFLDP